jgi:hypothetical protein
LIAQVTLDYLTKPDGILMLCLTWAILVKAVQSKELGTGIEHQKRDSERSAVDSSTDRRPGMEGQMI